MPIYSFKDKESGDVFDLLLKISEKEEFLKANPQLESIITGAPKIISGREGGHKPDEGFNELLSRIGEANPHTNLGRAVNKADSKQQRINKAVDNYKKRIGAHDAAGR